MLIMLNRVKPNFEKSVFIHDSSKFQSNFVPSFHLVVRDSNPSPVEQCMYLCFTIDSHLSFSSNIRTFATVRIFTLIEFSNNFATSTHRLPIVSSKPSFFLVSTISTALSLVYLLLLLIVFRRCLTPLQGSFFAFIVESM
jgi:hypothetical protein